METVKKHIGSTEYGKGHEGHKNSLNTTPVHTRKTGISVIRFSLQFGETELRREKDTSDTRRAKTGKMEKVARGDESDAQRTKIDFFNKFKHLRYGIRLQGKKEGFNGYRQAGFVRCGGHG